MMQLFRRLSFLPPCRSLSLAGLDPERLWSGSLSPKCLPRFQVSDTWSPPTATHSKLPSFCSDPHARRPRRASNRPSEVVREKARSLESRSVRILGAAALSDGPPYEDLLARHVQSAMSLPGYDLCCMTERNLAARDLARSRGAETLRHWIACNRDQRGRPPGRSFLFTQGEEWKNVNDRDQIRSVCSVARTSRHIQVVGLARVFK
jgi:hypothetical protein